MPAPYRPDATDRQIIAASQNGLPLVAQPYHALAETLGLSAAEVMQRFQAMLDAGVIRRLGAIPNHYAIGYRANGMSVWDVADLMVTRLGNAVGAMPFVSHCYRRPRQGKDWPYNLFAMVHGPDRDAVNARVADIAALLGDHCRAHKVLFSTRILKKTGLRLSPKEEPDAADH